MKKKGVSHIDYIIAISMMIIILAVVVGFLNSFLSNLRHESESSASSTDALSVLSGLLYERGNISSRPFELGTKAYKIYITLNNTQNYYKNQSLVAANQTSELVSFNYTQLGYTASVNSTAIYNESNSSVNYNINSDIISFTANIASSGSALFTVYFDADSNFTGMSVPVSGFDNITEVFYPAEELRIVQYKKIIELNKTSYSLVKNMSGIPDFRLRIVDMQTNQTFLDYGSLPPSKANVVALQRYVLYQNSTAGIRQGRIIIQTW